MATVEIWKIKSRLDRVINYVKDENKTTEFDDSNECGKKLYVDGVNCDVDFALFEMKMIKKRFNKEQGILGYHAYQSFDKDEISPEEAHQVGLELAKEMWGDRFQVIVATHLNTEHIHNHFVINSVSFVDGKKYYDNHSTYAELRRISDEICKEHNLSVLEEKTTRKGMNYKNFQIQNSSNMNYYKLAKYNLDLAISKAHTYNEFVKIMNNMNYEVIVRSGKISIRDFDYKRNIRIERYYGSDYSIENINKQIKGIYIPTSTTYYADKSIELFNNKLIVENKNLLRIYIKYLYLLNLYPKYVKHNKISQELKQDILKMEELSQQARLLVDKNLGTDKEFLSYYDMKNNDLLKLINQKEQLKNKTEVNNINEEISKLRKEIKLLEGIRTRKEKIKSNIEIIEKEVVNYEHIR